jgi:hypothetical protein
MNKRQRKKAKQKLDDGIFGSPQAGRYVRRYFDKVRTSTDFMSYLDREHPRNDRPSVPFVIPIPKSEEGR